MRTTIDLPDDLLRRTKAAAALRGMKLKDYVAAILERNLKGEGQEPRRQTTRELPVMIPATGRKIPVLTNAEIFELLDDEDDERHGRLS